MGMGTGLSVGEKMKEKPKSLDDCIAELENDISEMREDWCNLAFDIEEAHEQLKRLKDERLWQGKEVPNGHNGQTERAKGRRNANAKSDRPMHPESVSVRTADRNKNRNSRKGANPKSMEA
jgi:hypothetical protein